MRGAVRALNLFLDRHTDVFQRSALRREDHTPRMSAPGLGCVKTVLLLVRAEDKCEQDAARA
jgi:hypothetical protein